MRNPFQHHLEQYREQGIEYLRQNVPEIIKLESLDELKDLQLTNQTDVGSALILQYSASAPDLFPHVRQRLIDMGVTKRILGTKRRDVGTPEETYMVRMGYYSEMLQIALTVKK